MQYHQAALMCAVLALAVLAQAAPGEAFRLFGGGGSSGTPAQSAMNSTNGSMPTETAVNSSSPDAGSTGQYVRLLVRKVDSPDPYFRSMSFFVPQELNYMLGEYLLKDFTRAVEKHCKVSNITMVVQNDLVLVKSDTDVWRFSDGDRIEVWTRRSGPPTRARTAMALARGARPGGRPPCRPGQRRCRGFSTVEDADAVPVPDDSSKVEVASEDADDEPIVVPDWSQMP